MSKTVLLWALLGLTVRVSVAGGQINATVGENVTLTFQALNNLSIIVVKCTRADLKLDDVFLYRDGRLEPDNQHHSFKEQVELQEKQTKDGDVSVILKNVTTADEGTYECLIVQRGENGTKKENISISLGVVGPPGQPGGTTEDGGKKGEHVGWLVGVPVAVVVIFAIVGVAYYIKHNERQHQDLNSPPTQTQMSLSSLQQNSESPAAAPLLSVVLEHRDRNDLVTDAIQQHSTNTSDVTKTLEEEPLHPPQEIAGLHHEAVTSLSDEHPGCDGLVEPEG